MKEGHTNRGFKVIEFLDRYDVKCSIQKSSIATEDCIWFGVNNCKPKILATEAHQFGIITKETTGWVGYPIPPEVLLTKRMHLNVEQVKKLIPILQKFVETGEVSLK